jgi:hypothetical protein
MKYRNAWPTYEGFQCSLLEVEKDSRTDLRNQDDHQEHEKLRRKNINLKVENRRKISTST